MCHVLTISKASSAFSPSLSVQMSLVGQSHLAASHHGWHAAHGVIWVASIFTRQTRRVMSSEWVSVQMPKNFRKFRKHFAVTQCCPKTPPLMSSPLLDSYPITGEFCLVFVFHLQLSCLETQDTNIPAFTASSNQFGETSLHLLIFFC